MWPKCSQKPAQGPLEIDEKSTLWPRGEPRLSRVPRGIPPARQVIQKSMFVPPGGYLTNPKSRHAQMCVVTHPLFQSPQRGARAKPLGYIHIYSCWPMLAHVGPWTHVGACWPVQSTQNNAPARNSSDIQLLNLKSHHNNIRRYVFFKTRFM